MADSDEKLLSGMQAAEFLGVKAATLYAYASRGLIESVQTSTGRERSYRLSELVKLRNTARGVKSQRDSEPAVWMGPLIKSSITDIQEKGHKYRGQDAIELAKDGTAFEVIAELLWDSGQTSTRDWRKAAALNLGELMKGVKPDLDYFEILKLLLISVEISDPVSCKLLSDDVYDAARSLIKSMALMPGLDEEREQYVSQSDFQTADTLGYVLTGSKSSERARLINIVLVLCADHELNASALNARIAASCDAPLYSCLLSALGTFGGSMHGAASHRAEDLVYSSFKFKTAASWLKDYLRHSDSVYGFGTDLYEGGDPRARMLIDTAKAAGSKNKNLSRLIEIVDCVREQLGVEPNLDVGLAAMSYALSLPSGSGSIMFAVSRSAGWIAHAIEQRLYGTVIRPRAKYIGKV